MPKNRSVAINGETVPCKDVIETRIQYDPDSGTIRYQVKYRVFDPEYQEKTALLPKEEGYKVELAVRKASR